MYARTSGCMIFTLGSCLWRFPEFGFGKKFQRVASRVNGSEATRRPSKTYKPPQEANGTNRLAAHPKLQEESKGSRIQTTNFLLSIGIESPGYLRKCKSHQSCDMV